MDKSTRIKGIADRMFGIEFKEKVVNALNGISEEELKNLKKTAKGRKVLREIENAKGK